MSLFDAIKNMSLDEFLVVLRLLGADADYLYCRCVCEYNHTYCELPDDSLPCDGIDALNEVLNADFELFREYIEEECHV